jgi:hypothetical protein
MCRQNEAFKFVIASLDRRIGPTPRWMKLLLAARSLTEQARHAVRHSTRVLTNADDCRVVRQD